jgi:predicted nuclease of predicted toxin-antitoxin system
VRPKLVIDMNLSPQWAQALLDRGWEAVHWSTVGDPRATDRAIMDWAVANQYVVFTHDLDFGAMLALSHEAGPSVLQVRAQNVLPDHLGAAVVAALGQHEEDLSSGALVVVDEGRSRVRVLPI